MAEIIWAEPALQDLDEIADYIALYNEEAAQQLVRKVFDRIEQLVNHPLSGREIPELEFSVFRELIVPPCRIFYRIENTSIYITHIQREEQYFRNPFF